MALTWDFMDELSSQSVIFKRYNYYTELLLVSLILHQCFLLINICEDDRNKKENILTALIDRSSFVGEL